MKLILAIVNQDDGDAVAAALAAGGYACTRLASQGGYLDLENLTLLIGTADEEIGRVKQIIRSHVRRREKPFGGQQEYSGFAAPEEESVIVSGATIFVLDAEQFERI